MLFTIRVNAGSVPYRFLIGVREVIPSPKCIGDASSDGKNLRATQFSSFRALRLCLRENSPKTIGNCSDRGVRGMYWALILPVVWHTHSAHRIARCDRVELFAILVVALGPATGQTFTDLSTTRLSEWEV